MGSRRSKLKDRATALAQENLAIIEAGGYEGADGWIELGDEFDDAIGDTRLFQPEQLRSLLRKLSEGPGRGPAAIEVTGETTSAAARRLALDEGCEDLALLNFASGRNPGGSFLRGGKAQEEDLARSSALYACLTGEEATPYYAANRRQDTLYTDAMIWSPQVPFFRGDQGDLLDEPFFCSIITAPAPNAGAYLGKGGDASKVEVVMRRRCGLVLALARAMGARTLILGAWGCGVFRNDPVLVADAFGKWLEDPRFEGAFDRVVFAVWDPKGAVRQVFTDRLTSD